MSENYFTRSETNNKDSICKKITEAVKANEEILKIINSRRNSKVIAGYSFSLCQLPLWKLESTPITKNVDQILEKWEYNGKALVPLEDFFDSFIDNYEISNLQDIEKINGQLGALGIKGGKFLSDNIEMCAELRKAVVNLELLNIALKEVLDMTKDMENLKTNAELSQSMQKILSDFERINGMHLQSTLSVSVNGIKGEKDEECIVHFDNPERICCKQILGCGYFLTTVAQSGSNYIVNADWLGKEMKIWDALKNTCKATLTSSGYIFSLQNFTINGNSYIACGMSDPNNIEIWDVENKKLIGSLKGHSYEINALSVFHMNGQHFLASAGGDYTIKIWNLSTHACVRTITGHSRNIYALTSFETNGNVFLVSGSYDESIKIWDLRKLSEVATLTDHSEPVRALTTYCNNEKFFLVSGSYDRTIKIWDLSTRECITTLKGHSNEVHALAIFQSNGSTCLASGSNEIILWNLASNSIIATLSSIKSISPVTSLLIFCDENNKFYLVSGHGNGGEIMMWSE